MRLQAKFALYNTLSKAVIILIFVMIMPLLMKQISLVNTDNDLEEKKEQVMSIIAESGIESFITEGSGGSYGSYNILKEEFISLEQTDSVVANTIENSARLVEDDIVDYRVLTHSFVQDGKQYVLEVGRSLYTIQEIEATLRRLAFYTLIVISLLTILSDIAFTKVLLKPLNQIVSKLKETRDPSSNSLRRIETNTTDFKYLDDTIHEMLGRIEKVFLKEREFISNVSHELLTPISILQTKLENMLADESMSEESEMKLIEAQKTLIRLKNIVRALLLISKIENDQYLKDEQASTRELVQEVKDEIEDRLHAREIEMTTDEVEDFEIISCNRSLLHTMIFNLVNNAIKYNSTGGSILVRGTNGPSGYLLQIRDTGVGIPTENLHSIFNRFKRLQKSDTESFGLGLPIVKTIADFHGVTIDVTSQPGAGSTFTLSFPAQMIRSRTVNAEETLQN